MGIIDNRFPFPHDPISKEIPKQKISDKIIELDLSHASKQSDPYCISNQIELDSGKHGLSSGQISRVDEEKPTIEDNI